MDKHQEGHESRPAGYAAIIDMFGLDVIPNWHRSFVTEYSQRRTDMVESAVEECYPVAYWPGNTLAGHLEFALKYDGVNLAILAALFEKVADKELAAYVRSKPTGKYARRIWFLYEFLTGKSLPLDDARQGNYIDLLDPDEYYTAPARPSRRHRVNDNLLGNSRFCPLIRRTQTLRDFENADLAGKSRRMLSAYPVALLRRALSYLYTKETKSSFEIEHIRPTSSRVERFVAMLQLAEQQDFCTKAQLIALQNRIVDPRFADEDYRSSQNYVGETVAWQRERVHFVSPKPDDLPGLMEGMEDAHGRMTAGKVHPVIHAAAISYGFVFLHPFEDGNGRIHRFLIHNILARRGFTPEGLMFPVSAVMLKHPADYDASLEAFSRPLLTLVDYSLDEEGRMTVRNDTAKWYRYIDMTPQAEGLFRFIAQTIDTELADELAFLANYDRTKESIQAIVDMPDRMIDLFIRLCLQNNGKISASKRKDHFESLSDSEIARMEEVVQAAYGNSNVMDE